ncbi:sti1 [Symbiodinium sp. KB8]|nr:sti1 [Symbiodinium sp. KB8]
MDAAFASKDEDDAAARAERAKDAETSFATGFKKGFLLSKPTKTQAKPAAAKPAPAPASTPSSAVKQPTTSPSGAEPGVVEVGADGTFDVPDAPPPAPAPAVPTLRASPDASKAGLAMPEVQAAMKEKLGAFGEQLASGSWMTPDLQQRIFSNPRLMAGMSNPKCMAALQEFQAKPEAAMAKYAADPLIRDFLTEFFGIMGDHFTKLGEAEKASSGGAAAAPAPSTAPDPGIGMTARATKRTQAPQPGTAPAEFTSMDAEKRKKQAEAMAQAARRGDIAKDDAEVAQVLSDPAVLQLLMDPAMQRVLEECRQQPQRLGMYMRNPTVRENLLKLQEAGLIRITK